MELKKKIKTNTPIKDKKKTRKPALKKQRINTTYRHYVSRH